MNKPVVTCIVGAALSLLLEGCGGGGNTRPTVAPPSPPPVTTAYDPTFNQLVPTGVQPAQKAGFTGKGVKIGIMGFGVDAGTPPLQGRIAWFKSYLLGGNQTPNDTTGHGTVVADILGGLPQGVIPFDNGETFPGGVAQDAALYVEQVCAATGTPPCTWHANNFNDFVSQQVRVINISLGEGDVLTEFTGPGDPNIPLVQAIYQPAVNAGTVLVWVAGNDGHGQPWQDAGLPYWIPAFQPNWLAVVNVAIDASGNPAGLYKGAAEPSNACGVAAPWCIGAPGVVFTPTPNVPGTGFNGGGVGTSFAAPIISGVAAQVLQAFPWMSAGNITDTILTTATPLDDGSHQTPNATFGWGMVNAAKAVNGPAQFAFPQFGPFAANVPAGTAATFGNDISGPGGLQLTGPGVLTLYGANTYQGATEISAGTLAVMGSITSATTVDVPGILAGTGVVNADVANNGTVVSQGGKAGQGLTIGGNLTDGTSSITAVALGDPLQVKFTATIAGSMNVLGAPGGYTVQSTENLLTAGTVAGTFGSLTFASGLFYTGTLSYTRTQVDVALTQTSVAAAAMGAAMPMATRETRLSAAAVQQALDVSNGWYTRGDIAGHEAWFIDAGRFLASPNGTLATASLNSLSGEIYATSRGVEIEQSIAADAALANRERDLRFDTSPGAWVQALGADGTLSRSGYESADYRAGGVMVGLDGRLGAGFSAGLAAGRTHADVTMATLGGKLDGRETVFAAYGYWDAGSNWYASGRVSYASIGNNIHRTVLLGTDLMALTAWRTDHVSLGTLEGGKVIDVGGSTLTPFASVGALHLAQDDFAETGSAMGLNAPSQTHDATLGTVGLRYRKGFDGNRGHSWLTGYLAYRHILSGAGLAMDASFNGVSGPTFEAEGQNLPRNLGIMGIGLTTQVNAHWSWHLDADYQAGSEGAHQVEADAGIKITF